MGLSPPRRQNKGSGKRQENQKEIVGQYGFAAEKSGFFELH